MSKETLNTHSFSINVAKEHGVEAASVLAKLQYWIDHNRANGTNLKDGRYWTYNTISAWKDQMPYFSESAIRRILKYLCDNGIILRGNYNNSAYDHTTWYAFADESTWICRNDNFDVTKSTNRSAETNKSLIQHTTQLTNTHNPIAPDGACEKVPDMADEIYAAYPKKVGKFAALKAIRKALRETPAAVLLERVGDFSRSVRGKDPQYIPHPATWFNSGRYLDETIKPAGTPVTGLKFV